MTFTCNAQGTLYNRNLRVRIFLIVRACVSYVHTLCINLCALLSWLYIVQSTESPRALLYKVSAIT